MKLTCLLLVAVGLCAAAPMNEEREIEQIEQDAEKYTYTWKSNDDISTLSPRDFFDITSWDAIEAKSNMPQALSTVKDKLQVYYSVDPSEAMKKLAEVGSLLRIAYAGSKGFPSSTAIVKVMSGYQNLVKDSLITSATFVEIVLKALKYHKLAAIFAGKSTPQARDVEKALKYLKKCATMADRMAQESQTLIDKSDALVNLALDALVQANQDFVGSKQEQARIQDVIDQLKAQKAGRDQLKNDLAARIAEAKKNEEKNAALAGEKETWGVVLDVFQPLLQIGITAGVAALGDEPMYDGEAPATSAPAPVTAPPAPVPKDCSKAATMEGIKGQAQEARCREENARRLRVHYQQQQLVNNADLAKTIEALVNKKASKDKLDKSIYGLDITIKVLGQVRTIFLNAKTFWVGVKKHTEALAGTQEEFEDYAEDPDLMSEFMESLERSGYSWLTLGKICRASALTIRQVDKGVDNMMNNLPTEAEAEKLIEELGAEILKDIKEDNEVIKAEIESKHNKLPLPPMPK